MAVAVLICADADLGAERTESVEVWHLRDGNRQLWSRDELLSGAQPASATSRRYCHGAYVKGHLNYRPVGSRVLQVKTRRRTAIVVRKQSPNITENSRNWKRTQGGQKRLPVERWDNPLRRRGLDPRWRLRHAYRSLTIPYRAGVSLRLGRLAGIVSYPLWWGQRRSNRHSAVAFSFSGIFSHTTACTVGPKAEANPDVPRPD